MEGFFVLLVCGAYMHGGAYFRNFRVSDHSTVFS